MGWLIRIPVEPDDGDPDRRVELLASRLWDLGTTGLWHDRSTIVAGFADEAAARSAAAALDRWADQPGAGRSTITVEPAPGPEALASVGERRPVTITDGSGRTITFDIDPGPTFGHGNHPSTRLALDRLASIVRPGHAVLDVGTGSGVLAVAAALLGAGDVSAVDVDPVAASTARANAEANGVSIDSSTTTVSQVLTDRRRPFDVVAVNVLLPVHRQLAAEVANAIGPGGLVTAAGFLRWQLDAVVEAHPRLRSIDRSELGDWAELLLTRR